MMYRRIPDSSFLFPPSPFPLWLPIGRIRLSEPMAEVVILHVLHHDALFMNESDLAEASWVEGAEQEFLPLEGGLQVFHAIGDMGPMPQFPQPNLIGGYFGKLLGANVLKALWMA